MAKRKKSHTKKPSKNETQKSKGKTPGKKTTRQVRTTNKADGRAKKTIRGQANRTKGGIQASKLVGKIPRQVQKTKRSRFSSKGFKEKQHSRKISGTLEVAKQTKKTGKQLDFTFKGTKKVENKIALFEAGADKAIKRQLSKRGGKPPRGIVVVVTDKNGREAGKPSSLRFVVNEKNTKKFTLNFLKELEKDHLAWKDAQKKRVVKKKGKKPRGKTLVEDETDSGYGDYNPENIKDVSIKFIY